MGLWVRGLRNCGSHNVDRVRNGGLGVGISFAQTPCRMVPMSCFVKPSTFAVGFFPRTHHVCKPRSLSADEEAFEIERRSTCTLRYFVLVKNLVLVSSSLKAKIDFLVENHTILHSSRVILRHDDLEYFPFHSYLSLCCLQIPLSHVHLNPTRSNRPDISTISARRRRTCKAKLGFRR